MVFDAINALRMAAVKIVYDAGLLDTRLSVSEHVAHIGKLSAHDIDVETMVIGGWRNDYCVVIDKFDIATVYFEAKPIIDLRINGVYKECMKVR